jgi:arsenate reductase
MHRYHWGFPDPAAVEGTREAKLEAFRKIRDQIKDRIEAWLMDPSIGLRGGANTRIAKG